MIIPQYDWRGNAVAGYCIGTTVCSSLQWPEKLQSPWAEDPVPTDTSGGPAAWAGNLIDTRKDGSGYVYMRNRYYDPSSGRFTQEDPIGLAGGLNAYGFANGDPVNFSDPFGLCPPEDHDPCNMHTGNKFLDDPSSRNQMERAFKRSEKSPDEDGVAREVGGSCDKQMECQEAVGTWNNVGEPIVPGAAFDYHTHAAEGIHQTKHGWKIAATGPSDVDISGQMDAKYPQPSFIVGPRKIWVMQYNAAANKVEIQTFDRFDK